MAKHKGLTAGTEGRKGRRFDYNAQGSPEEHEAEDEKPGFKRGGRHRKRRKKEPKAEERREEKREERKHHEHETGHAEGHRARRRADRRPRRAAGGRTPYSSGHSMGAESEDRAGMGHEGVRPASEDH